jgi:hypothetical protein
MDVIHIGDDPNPNSESIEELVCACQIEVLRSVAGEDPCPFAINLVHDNEDLNFTHLALAL